MTNNVRKNSLEEFKQDYVQLGGYKYDAHFIMTANTTLVQLANQF